MTIRMNRETWVSLGVLVALVAGAVFAVYLPQRRRMREVRTAIAEHEAALEADRDKVRAVPALAREVRRLRELYSDFDRKMPQSHELFGFLKQIGTSLDEADLDSQSIQPGAPAQEGLFHALPIIMRCRGRYADLSAFLAEIDRMERLTRVRKLDLRSAGPNGQIDIAVHMNIYFTQQ